MSPSGAPRLPGAARISRRALVGTGTVAAVASVAAVDGLFVTPGRLATSDHVVGTGRTERPLRIVQVSDLHVHRIGRVERHLLERLHESS